MVVSFRSGSLFFCLLSVSVLMNGMDESMQKAQKYREKLEEEYSDEESGGCLFAEEYEGNGQKTNDLVQPVEINPSLQCDYAVMLKLLREKYKNDCSDGMYHTFPSKH